MKRILAILLQLLCAVAANAVLPTPVTLTVSVNTNGVLVSPTNFWAVNSNALNAVVWPSGDGAYVFATNSFVQSGSSVALASPIVGTFGVSNAPTIRLTATNIWVESRGTMRIYTPAVSAATAAVGQALVLTDDANGAVEFGDAIPIGEKLRGWVAGTAFTLSSTVMDGDGVITTATVVWPDGSTGTLTTTAKNSTFMVIDGFSVTHNISGLTATQPTVTRNAAGAVTAQPAITITP